MQFLKEHQQKCDVLENFCNQTYEWMQSCASDMRDQWTRVHGIVNLHIHGIDSPLKSGINQQHDLPYTIALNVQVIGLQDGYNVDKSKVMNDLVSGDRSSLAISPDSPEYKLFYLTEDERWQTAWYAMIPCAVYYGAANVLGSKPSLKGYLIWMRSQIEKVQASYTLPEWAATALSQSIEDIDKYIDG